MTHEKQIELMKVKLKDVAIYEEDDLEAYLDLAKDKILQHIYPFNDQQYDDLDSRYHAIQVELACALYERKGADGEKEHVESGVRNYFRSEAEILASITRKGSVFA